jgi:hypothetical protein
MLRSFQISELDEIMAISFTFRLLQPEKGPLVLIGHETKWFLESFVAKQSVASDSAIPSLN